MASGFKDYYELLEVPRTATQDDIKQAYRRLARQHHPDLHPEKEKDVYTRRMQEINEAYAVLSSPENRTKYDQLGEHWQEGPPPPPPYGAANEKGPSSREEAQAFSDFFRRMFREQAHAPEEGDSSELDVEAELTLSLEEAVRGIEKSFRLMATALCPNCRGTGRKGKAICQVCGGVGEIQKPHDIKAKIPPGLLEGARIRLKGQGHEGPRGRGDLYLLIHLLPDPRFSVEGKNVETELRVMPWQAALGSEVSVPTLEGPLRIRVPKGTHTGARLRVAGKGLGNPHGDLFIRVLIDIPDQLTPDVEALFQRLKDATHD